VSKIRQLRPIKIDYSRVHNLEYIDKNNLKPQTFAAYQQCVIPETFEIDVFGARTAGKWAAETGHSWFVSNSLISNTFEHVFVGAQRGRWRVRARLVA